MLLGKGRSPCTQLAFGTAQHPLPPLRGQDLRNTDPANTLAGEKVREEASPAAQTLRARSVRVALQLGAPATQTGGRSQPPPARYAPGPPFQRRDSPPAGLSRRGSPPRSQPRRLPYLPPHLGPQRGLRRGNAEGKHRHDGGSEASPPPPRPSWALPQRSPPPPTPRTAAGEQRPVRSLPLPPPRSSQPVAPPWRRGAGRERAARRRRMRGTRAHAQTRWRHLPALPFSRSFARPLRAPRGRERGGKYRIKKGFGSLFFDKISTEGAAEMHKKPHPRGPRWVLPLVFSFFPFLFTRH